MSDETTTKKVNKRNFGCKIFIYVFTIFIVLLVCCIGFLSSIWATGHLKKILCSNVLVNSEIYNSINCIEEINKPDQIINPIDNNFSENSTNISKIFEDASKGVVGIAITTQNNMQDQIIGTGFVINANGLIATNQHVVSDRNSKYQVKFDGIEKLVDVKEIYRDGVNDIAIIKVDSTNLTPLALGNSDNLKPGETVVAIGNPFGKFSSTVTSGIISGLNRQVNLGNSFLQSTNTLFEDTIQTDAAINPGNSGGPLLNSRGQVIGINFATVQGADNLSFAIPVNYLKNRINELNEFSRFRTPYIGIQYRNRLVSVADEVLFGAQVTLVDPKGAAVKLIEIGDLIVSFDGKDLESESLAGLIQKSKIGDTKELIVISSAGARRTVQIKIIESPKED